MWPTGMTKLSSLMYCGFLWRVRDFTASGLDTNRLYLVSVASDCTHNTSTHSLQSFAVMLSKLITVFTHIYTVSGKKVTP